MWLVIVTYCNDVVGVHSMHAVRRAVHKFYAGDRCQRWRLVRVQCTMYKPGVLSMMRTSSSTEPIDEHRFSSNTS